MRKEAVGIGREVEVFAEELLRRDQIGELHEVASVAVGNRKRELFLQMPILIRLQVRIGQRRTAEIEERTGQRRAASKASAAQSPVTRWRGRDYSDFAARCS